MKKNKGKYHFSKLCFLLMIPLILGMFLGNHSVVKASQASTHKALLTEIQPLAFPPAIATNSATVLDAAQFLAAYNNNDIDEIVLGSSFTLSTSTHSRSASLVIRGEGERLGFGTTILQVDTDALANGVFTMMDVEYHSLLTNTNHFIRASGTNTYSWEFNLSDITKYTATTNRPLVSAPEATVNIYNTNSWINNQSIGFIVANKVNVYRVINYTSTQSTSALSHLFQNALAGGSVNFDDGSQINANISSYGCLVYDTGGNLTVNVSGADFTITDVNYMFRSTADMTITMNDSNFTGTNVRGVIGVNTTADLTMTNTTFSATSLARFLYAGGSASVVTGKVTNSSITTDSLTDSLVAAGKMETIFTNTTIDLADYKCNVFALNSALEHTSLDSAATTGSKIEFYDSTFNVKQTTTSWTGPYLQNDGGPRRPDIGHANYVASDNVMHLNSQADILFRNTTVDGDIIDKFLLAEGFNSNNSSLTVDKGSVVNIYGAQDKIIAAGDIYSEIESTFQKATFHLNLSDSGTEMNLSGNSIVPGPRGGLVTLHGDGSTYNVNNGAKLNIHSMTAQPANNALDYGATSCIVIQANGGGFYLDNKGEVNLTQEGNPNRYSATIRFRAAGNMTFDIRNESKMTVTKNDGIGSAVRMGGSGNQILVSSGSDFTVLNKGSELAGVQDGMIKYENDNSKREDGFSQGVEFVPSSGETTQDGASFTADGENSNISVVAERGLAFDAGSGPFNITASNDAYFVARGNTLTQTEGIFQGENLTIDLNGTQYFDFANIRENGGRLFSMNGRDEEIAKSTFNVVNSNLMVWNIEDGIDVEGDPDNSWPYLDFVLTGNGYQTLEAGHNGDQSFVDAMENTGMTTLTRMTANNQRAIVDELRVATDADKYIYAHVVIPAGKGEAPTDATTDDVTVKINILDENNQVVATTTGKSIGDDLEVYGDAAQRGIVKIELPDSYLSMYKNFLSAKHSIEIVSVWRGPGDEGASTTVPSNDDDILVKTQEIEDVTPPETPVMVTDFLMTNATKQLKGTLTDDDGTKIYIKVNGSWLTDDSGNLASATLLNNGWTLNLPSYIDKDAEIEVFAKDLSTINGLGDAQTPESYTEEPDGTFGNLSKTLATYDAFTGYHDALDYSTDGGEDERFQPSLMLEKVLDVLPDAPKVAKSVASSSDTTTSVGDTLTYTTTLTNDKAATYDTSWKDIKLTDVLDPGLDFDSADSGIEVTVAGVAVTNPTFNYDEQTRVLTIEVGVLASQEVATVTFKATVNTSALGTTIRNTATGTGDGPQETPFVAGAENPDSDYISYGSSSNEVSNPGGAVLGAFDLRIEFQNEAGNAITTAIVATRNVGTRVNLLTDTELSKPISDKIAALEENYYTLSKRPDNEANVEVELNGTTVVYQFTGMLTVASHSKVISFGEIAFNGREQRITNPVADSTQDDLVVADTRADGTDGWTLLVALTKPMATNTRTDDLVLNEDAVRYVTGEAADGSIEEVTLNKDPQPVYSHVRETSESGLFNVTDTWGSPAGTTQTGLNLVIKPADVVGAYTGEITWTFQSGPA